MLRLYLSLIWLLISSFIVAVLLGITSPLMAVAQQVGDTVQLNAERTDGVPLHRNPRPSIFARVADDTVGTVIAVTSDRRWISIRLEDGRTGWIVPRYIGRIASAGGGVPGDGSGQTQEAQVWASRDGCLTVVQAGGRLPKEEAQSWRIATWNIRWFPQGAAPGESASTLTDLEWLACAITWLDADLIAVQEILRTQQAEEALGTLLGHLATLTGQPWNSSFQQCGGASAQHVGFLWNTGRIDLTGGRDEWRLNGGARNESNACAGNLRPGYYGHARSLTGGADFHMIVVHSDSGRADRDIGNRERARDRIGAIATELAPTDRDIVILGDFNTMGANSGKSAEQEIDELRAALEGQLLPFRHLTLQNQCTEYFEGQGGWLDHIVATQAMNELRPTTARVSGYCAVAQCQQLSDANMPAAYKNLSDHCPLVVDLGEADQD